MAFDMETQDPDDALTLCILATHPEVRLRAVTVNPGSRAQIGIVRHLLERLERSDVRVGAGRPDHPKRCVSGFHYRWLGEVSEADADGLAADVLREAHQASGGALRIVTGGPLTNVAAFLNAGSPEVLGITVQGGFAGDSVVPEEHRLGKFMGKETCPTFNLNGDVRAAFKVLDYGNFGMRRLVSKNVCHGVAWGPEMHERMTPLKDQYAGLSLVWEAMDLYLARKERGKLLHDPLAACAAIDPFIIRFAEVEVYRERGEWGSRLKDGTGTFISTALDRPRFERVLAGLPG